MRNSKSHINLNSTNIAAVLEHVDAQKPSPRISAKSEDRNRSLTPSKSQKTISFIKCKYLFMILLIIK